jgi:hypothetical protein
MPSVPCVVLLWWGFLGTLLFDGGTTSGTIPPRPSKSDEAEVSFSLIIVEAVHAAVHATVHVPEAGKAAPHQK